MMIQFGNNEELVKNIFDKYSIPLKQFKNKNIY